MLSLTLTLTLALALALALALTLTLFQRAIETVVSPFGIKPFLDDLP